MPGVNVIVPEPSPWSRSRIMRSGGAASWFVQRPGHLAGSRVVSPIGVR